MSWLGVVCAGNGKVPMYLKGSCVPLIEDAGVGEGEAGTVNRIGNVFKAVHLEEFPKRKKRRPGKGGQGSV